MWHENLNKSSFIGITIALVGLIVLNFSGLKFNTDVLLGNLFALMAGLSMGIYLILGNYLKKRIHLIHYLTMVSLTALILLLTTTLFFDYNLFGYTQSTYTMMALLAIIPQLIGHSCLNIALRILPTTMVSVAILGEPIGAVLLGYLILGEIPSINELLGSIIIIAGITTVIRSRNYITN
jgi:drug/metabolite transporter (DMT)-like permease